MTVHGLVDSLYIKELGKKTFRGLQGRAIQGLHTGGRCFGYDIVHDGDSVRYVINDSEAAIVRRIETEPHEGSACFGVAQRHARGPAPVQGNRYAGA